MHRALSGDQTQNAWGVTTLDADVGLARPWHGAGTTSGCRAHARGFTLIELMVVVAITAILLGMAVPSFIDMIARNRMVSATNEFVGMINTAKSEAVRRATEVRVLSKDGTAVFSAGGVDVAPSAAVGSVIRTKEAFEGNVRLTRVTSATSSTLSTASDLAYLEFNSRGATTSGADAFFRVCNSANAAIPGRVIKVNQVGRVQLQTANVTCP